MQCRMLVIGAALAALAGCGGDDIDVVDVGSGTGTGTGSTPVVADAPASAWGLAVPAPGEINLPGEGATSPGYDGCPIESPDGLSLYIATRRAGGEDDLALDGDLDIWVSDRAAVGDAWPAPRSLGKPVNSPTAQDFCPTPVFGQSLMFVSTRGSCGGGDIYIARHSLAGGWTEPVMLPCAPDGPNSSGPERSPSIVEGKDGTWLVYSSNGGSGSDHIYMSKQAADGSFGPGQPIADLNSDYVELMPNVRRKGDGSLEIVFSSTRPNWGTGAVAAVGLGLNHDVYLSTAGSVAGPWSVPRNLGANVNSADADETRATLSADGKRLYFGRNGDIYVSERPGE